MNVSLGSYIFIQSINLLFFRKRSQCRNIENLCLSSLEQSGTMNGRKYIDFCGQWTDLCYFTTIRTFVVFQDHLTNGLFLEFIYSLINQSKPIRMLFFIAFFQFIFDLTDIFFTNLFYVSKYSLFHRFRCNEVHHVFKHVFRNIKMLIFVFFFSTFCYDLIKEFDDLSIDFVSFVNRFDHLIFRHFIGTGFDHNNFFSCRSYRKSKVRNLSLCGSWVDYKFSVYETNLCCCRRSVKWNIRNAGCQSGTKHCRKFRAAVLIYTHNEVFQCNIVTVIFWEQRTHRSVDNTVCKDCIVRRFSFSSCESSGNFSYGIHLFTIFYAKWEEVNSFPWLL